MYVISLNFLFISAGKTNTNNIKEIEGKYLVLGFDTRQILGNAT